MENKRILLRRGASISAWVAEPPVLFTLLILSFGAGMLVVWLLLRVAPASPAPQVPSPVPRTPTPIPPTPTFVPTPTPISNEENSTGAPQPLETLYINIAPDDFAQIEAKRQEALEHWILLTSGADFVDATLHTGQGPVIPVELRLKGDWGDHYIGDKWSFRIETQGDHHLWGMAVFSLQDPGTRAYLNEWLFMAHLRAEDVLSVRYRFVHVVQNGAYKGIYALEEGFSKELFESLQRREGVIIRYDEDLVWAYRVAYANDELVPRGVNEFHLIDEFDSNRINANPTLSAQRDAAVGKLRALWTGEQTASEVFDIETMGKFLALTDLWGARHALIWHNVRFYYNPVTTRLEPIGFDTQPLAGGATVTLDSLDGLRRSLAYGEREVILSGVEGSPSHLQQAYANYLWQFSQPAYLTWLQARFGSEFTALREALRPEFGPEENNERAPDVLAPPWDILAQRQASLRELLTPYQTVYAYISSPSFNPSTSPTPYVSLEVGNLLDLPVELVGLLINEDAGGISEPREMIPVRPEWLVADTLSQNSVPVLPALAPDAAFISYTRLHVPLQTLGIDPRATTPSLTLSRSIETLPNLQIVTRIWGLTRTVTQTVAPRYPPPLAQGPLPSRPTVEEALDKHPYLQVYMEGVVVGDLTQHDQDTKLYEKFLHIPSGTHTISGNLVLPEGYGLILDPGTTLRFGSDNFLLANGPLIFEGTETMPVVLQPSGERWWGVVVMEAEAPSVWEHVTVERTAAIDQDGWILTGGITFYRSPIRLDHCRIVKTEAEDAINVIRAPFAFVESEFAETASDAFDADFAQGLVERCVFHDIAADGIDVSGAEVQVYDVRMQNIGDKGLSVGEQSRLTAKRVIFEDVNFGVVSKDLSQVTASALTIRRAQLAGLAAYIKKTAYGPASITATDITFVNIPQEHQTLVQTGSWIDLDGTRIWGTDVNVEALYEN
jgi:hypothetical protein